MALNDSLKQSAAPFIASSQGYARSARSKAVTTPAKPSQLERLAKPSRTPDYYLVDEAVDASRHAPSLDGLSAPKANVSRTAAQATPPRMQSSTTLPRIGAPRALEAGDVHEDAQALGHLADHFDVVPVQGDGFVSLIAGLLHHGARHPEEASALATGLRSFDEPTGETSPEAHAGYAMIKRWAQALTDGRGSEAKNDALKHPAAMAAMALALRGIVRHMQLFGTLKRPAKDKAGAAADMEGMHALAKVCGIKLVVHGAAKPSAAASAGASSPLPATLHLLARPAAGQLDVLVAKR